MLPAGVTRRQRPCPVGAHRADYPEASRGTRRHAEGGRLGGRAVNVVIWFLASVSAHHLIYLWPVWVAGPWGAILLAVLIGAAQIRRGGHPGPQLPPGQT